MYIRFLPLQCHSVKITCHCLSEIQSSDCPRKKGIHLTHNFAKKKTIQESSTQTILLMEEIPNNHLGCKIPCE